MTPLSLRAGSRVCGRRQHLCSLILNKNVQFILDATDNTAEAGISSKNSSTRLSTAGSSIPRGNLGHLSTFKVDVTNEQFSHDLASSTSGLPGEASLTAPSGNSLGRERIKRWAVRKFKTISKSPKKKAKETVVKKSRNRNKEATRSHQTYTWQSMHKTPTY
ncbi:hypothetical protein E2C01_041227 [Portunus trituberculatus]|uniref:Uncharacterized protein n=1 Tax=Portunus trituberculatus TaxID=210409 RepID=A0A5B7FQD3_PORTR|nr:hypothetical protein [Portunus trituberculatus]